MQSTVFISAQNAAALVGTHPFKAQHRAWTDLALKYPCLNPILPLVPKPEPGVDWQTKAPGVAQAIKDFSPTPEGTRKFIDEQVIALENSNMTEQELRVAEKAVRDAAPIWDTDFDAAKADALAWAKREVGIKTTWPAKIPLCKKPIWETKQTQVCLCGCPDAITRDRTAIILVKVRSGGRLQYRLGKHEQVHVQALL